MFFLNSGFFNKSKIDWNEMSCNFVHVFLLSFIFNLTEENFEMIIMSNLPSNSLQEGEHNLQEMKTKSPAWSSKGYHMYGVTQETFLYNNFKIHLLVQE